MIPGPSVGYMPQEVALYGEFTIKETLKFFGFLNGMDSDLIDERAKFLTQLLQLPEESEYVKTLSGGQQRRMSLAVALLSSPELLILDEPTVGVDPILRQIIWRHFTDITSNGNTTIIITTHYIDETKQAHLIGLMRGGRFLAEDMPENLLRRYNTDNLEEVFLRLATSQNNNNNDLQVIENLHEEESQESSFHYQHTKPKVNRKKIFSALVWKNYLWFVRHYR